MADKRAGHIIGSICQLDIGKLCRECSAGRVKHSFRSTKVVGSSKYCTGVLHWKSRTLLAEQRPLVDKTDNESQTAQ